MSAGKGHQLKRVYFSRRVFVSGSGTGLAVSFQNVFGRADSLMRTVNQVSCVSAPAAMGYFTGPAALIYHWPVVGEVFRSVGRFQILPILSTTRNLPISPGSEMDAVLPVCAMPSGIGW